MSIHVALTHRTHYQYDRPVVLSPQVVRLRPAPHAKSRVLSYSLRVEPEGHFVNWQQDPFSNWMARLVFPEKVTQFTVTVDLVVEMSVFNPFDFFLEPDAEAAPFVYADDLKVELAPYLDCEPAGPQLVQWLAGVDRSSRRTIDFLIDLNRKLQHDIRYLIRLEPGVQSPEQTLALGSGSCRDSAWLMVQALRQLGMAARFVSGYLIQLEPDQKAIDGPVGADHDFTDLHAWCEVFLPGAGWIGLDPTSGLLAGEGHLPLAASPSPAGAAPVEGAVEKCEVEFEHSMRVERLYESPRVTRPYTDAQWAEVLELGARVDQALQAGDVRLTMGGEPTFVSSVDREGAEWNTEAMGPTKRGLATELLGRLAKQWSPGGFLHFGQGKWYPGEQLPRWALSSFWRTDGAPCWGDPGLFADERLPGGATDADAERFVRALSGYLGVGERTIKPGFEDTFYYLWRERKLPVNVDPFDARLDDALERDRLRKVFEQGLSHVVGWVLPLAANSADPALGGHRWVTGPWFLRDERLYLIPGDSAMGWRLPLDSLPWVKSTDTPGDHPPDPMAPRAALPSYVPLRRQSAPGETVDAGRNGAAGSEGEGLDPAALSATGTSAGVGPGIGGTQSDPAARPPGRFESVAGLLRTALCVEVRDAHLYVFMPPLAHLEDYLALLAAVERTAAELNRQIVLEGYPPPSDPRLRSLQVTPDPGVIEVNIHPSRTFGEIVERTTFLYEAARHTRLTAEKFLLDGRHTGTGGGNHITMGGATAADSPFLRRPDLLASLLSYWHNHPSLSYLFSGLFIGPTSQAPRVDEARDDSLHELEIAFTQMRNLSGDSTPPAPWLVDRLLRNLLVDVTGNTHRAEFCIDKLYSPDGPTGRLGLLEMRAFEMPPHEQMSVVQQLLLRALVARFWSRPYTVPLVRWGTALHDRFLLPTFVQMDFEDVLAETEREGFRLDPVWFAPHFEFRFPRIGDIDVRGVSIELRMALEPWHVLGEQGGAGGTVRYVDSSVERLELRVRGMTERRHQVSVNGCGVPLSPTGVPGEFVAGVRYRAWQPPNGLHPTIGVHAPLTVDLVDTWLGRSIGGGQYHVSHPGGRNYEIFPVNSHEAESRRLSRFMRMGHTPGPQASKAPRFDRTFPVTMDLRQ